MALGLGRLSRIWMVLCAALALVSLTAIPTAAHAAPEAPTTAEKLKADFASWEVDIGMLKGDVTSFGLTLLPRYQCPPATPNKEAKFKELNRLAARLNRLRIRERGISDRRLVGGRAGGGQVTSGVKDRFRRGLGLGTPADVLITEADMKRAKGNLSGISSKIGQFRSKLNGTPPSAKECDPKTDPISTVTFSPPSKNPGDNVTGQITAKTASGKALIISAVTVTGINAVGAQTGIGGLGTVNVTYKFKIADIRRQGPFPLRVTVAGLPPGFPAGTAPLSRSINVNYAVKNVAPTIEKIPDAPTAKPGEALKLTGQVVVVDRNADNNNAGEVTRSLVKLSGGHPAALETVPGQAFRRFSSVKLVSHDASTGRYVFDVEQEAKVKLPHAHGKFPTSISAADRLGETAKKDIDLIVENVAPTITVKADGQHFHSGDGKQFTISGKVTDDNGAADIVEIVIDASKAVGGGPGIYRLSAGSVVKVGQPADDGYSYRINPAKVGHTDTSGKWQIDATVSDNGAPEQGSPAPLTAQGDTFITVTNLPPDSNAYGYLSNIGMEPRKKQVCPRDLIRLAIRVKDPENDRLKVTAVIKETGEKTELKIEPGNTSHTGYLLAPGKPGEYTIEFIIEEVKTKVVKKPHTVKKAIELTVVRCDDDDDDNNVAIAGPPGSEVKVGPLPPALPGEAPDFLAQIFDYARLMQMAALLDNLRGNTDAGMPPLMQAVLNSFWYQFLLDRPHKVMEGGANHPNGTCGTGSGEGPALTGGDPPNGNAPQESPIDFFNKLFADEIEARQAQASADGNAADPALKIDLNYKWRMTDSWSPKIEFEYKDWADDIKTEQAEAAPNGNDAGPGSYFDLEYKWKPSYDWSPKLEYEYNSWGDDVKVGSGTFNSTPYAGFLYGLTMQEGYAEEAPQTTLDSAGRGAIKYATPTFAGFTLSGSWGEDDQYDVALRYAGEFGSIRTAAGAAHSDTPSIGITPQNRTGTAGSGGVRYDSPTFAGFTLNADWDEDDELDASLRYANEFGGIKVAAAARYEPEINLDGGGPAHGGFVDQGDNGDAPGTGLLYEPGSEFGTRFDFSMGDFGVSLGDNFNSGLSYDGFGEGVQEDSCRIKKFAPATREPGR